ncbi:MAG: hypothetical protein U0892_22975 [Pirellulales bacterium]
MSRNAWLLVASWAILCTSFEHRHEASAQDASASPYPKPTWVWNTTDGQPAQKLSLRKEFTLDGEVKQALLAVSADNQSDVFINGRKVASSKEWQDITTADVANRFAAGENCIAISAQNEGGPAGLLFLLRILMRDGKLIDIVSDASWKASVDARGNWRAADFDDSKWASAAELGKLGDPSLPWSTSLPGDAISTAFSSGSGGEFIPVAADNAQAPEGFKVEKIFQVPRAMGSWVALTTDPKGRLIASDQGGAGLFMITPPTDGKPTKVERLPVDLSGAQGLLWAFDSLYAVVNGGSESGLHRLRDTNNDGLVDSDEYCMHVPGGGEHGPHGIVLSPDGKSLFVAAGNHTKLPESIIGSQLPRNWNEDHLLPRRWDANGHAAGILAPGGWICQVDPSGKQWQVYSMGYRNQYDLAFNTEGELFSYDSDMEWDLGAPWYRPTRVCHATSGSEFGWRVEPEYGRPTIKTRSLLPLRSAPAHRQEFCSEREPSSRPSIRNRSSSWIGLTAPSTPWNCNRTEPVTKGRNKTSLPAVRFR